MISAAAVVEPHAVDRMGFGVCTYPLSRPVTGQHPPVVGDPSREYQPTDPAPTAACVYPLSCSTPGGGDLPGASRVSTWSRRVTRFLVTTLPVVDWLRPQEGTAMAMEDKVQHAVEEVWEIKEGAGRATGDEDLKASGQADQAKAHVKQAGDRVADAAKDAFGN